MISIKNIAYGVVLGSLIGVTSGVLYHCTYNYGSVPAARESAQEIYKRLSLKTGAYVPPVIVADDPTINAWYDGSSVTITTGLLNAAKNDDEVAMVLAHEIAHALMDHTNEGMKQDSRYAEANADRMGAFIMLNAGYDICKGRALFLIFLNNYGEDPTEPTHPGDTYRYNLLSAPWCSQIGD